MCDFHLKGKCFHPEKVEKGLVAINCNVHGCTQCTNSSWQVKKINSDIEYYQSLIDLTATNIQSEIEGLPDVKPGDELLRKDARKKLFGVL